MAAGKAGSQPAGRRPLPALDRAGILDDSGRPDPDSVPDSFAWGVQAVGLPGQLSAFGVGDTLDQALDDLAEGIRALFSAGSVPDELTREIAVTVGDAA